MYGGYVGNGKHISGSGGHGNGGGGQGNVKKGGK